MLELAMTTALEVGTGYLERLAVWGKGILLGGLGDLMKMWIMLGRLSYRFQRSRSPKKVQSYIEMQQTTVHRILQNSLSLKPY
jgi:hypothetical protein